MLTGCPELKAQNSTLSQIWKLKKDTLGQNWKLKKGILYSGTYPVLPSMEEPPPPGTRAFII